MLLATMTTDGAYVGKIMLTSIGLAVEWLPEAVAPSVADEPAGSSSAALSAAV